jgi:hypothetical protein
MKATIKDSFKTLLSDRLVTVLLAVFVLACIAYSVFVAVSLRPSDLQVAVHYTAYGETNFYREKWYYLLTFVGFGLLVAFSHVILTAKIFLQERRQLALLFLGVSFLLLLIAWFITWSVLKIAFL